MKKILFCSFLFLSLTACKDKTIKQVELPSDSIFNLTSTWQTQNNETIELENLKGKTLVVVMIYTSCKTACPLLVRNMKLIEAEINPDYLNDIDLVLVSIDPETDTPEKLKEFSITNQMTDKQWIFLRGSVESTQEFANVLSMKYKKISPIDFSHSNIVSIFNPSGQLVSQTEGLEINTKEVAKKVNEVVKQFS